MNTVLKGSVELPGSKSESNRALMIAAYGGFSLQVDHLSEAHDTVLLQQLLNQVEKADPGERCRVDCEDAGAVARFLLTYLAGREGVWVMTGTQRLQQRPMGPLIHALRQLGADIVFLGKEGYLPLKVTGKPLEGGCAVMDVSQSSQFVSSLVLAAPTWKQGLVLKMDGDEASRPYLEMTLSMMRHFGASIQRKGSVITVANQSYQSRPFLVFADWSAASVWYELVALSDQGSLLLKGMRPDPLQGDGKVAEMYQLLGVETSFSAEGVRLVKTLAEEPSKQPLVFDVADTPDLFPAILATCVALHRPAVFHGTRNLRLKESNRVDSIISELSKVYTFINIIENNSVVIGKSLVKYDNIYRNDTIFSTYQDHRILMALAPCPVCWVPSLSISLKLSPNLIPGFGLK